MGIAPTTAGIQQNELALQELSYIFHFPKAVMAWTQKHLTYTRHFATLLKTAKIA
jgi:hypothetical protein